MITLSSDFGSPYPAAMRGVLASRSDARLVDVAHDFPRHDVRATAFWLRETLPWFPPAVHLIVVDPGVGTDRAALVVRAGKHYLVGPDNGVLRPVARRLAEGSSVEAAVIDDRDAESSTFHGRDVFAPAAATIHEACLRDGRALADLDRFTPTDPDSLVECRLPEAAVTDDAARGEVLAVDDFGNVITNVPGSFLAVGETIVANGERIPAVETFDAVDVGDRLATVGSHGYVELDVNRGRGDEAFGLAAGDAVELERI